MKKYLLLFSLLLCCVNIMRAEEQRVVRILAVGNSYSGDVIESWLSPLARNCGIQLIVGNAVYGGYGPREHWEDIVKGKAKTEYRKIAGGTYTLTSDHTLTEIIKDEPWDYITFQQNSQNSGIYSTYTPYLQNLIDYVKGIHPQAKLGWLMTWAYAANALQEGFANYNRNQMTMFNAILNATTRVMQDHPDLEFMVPCGTAIQNLRTSFTGDNVNRDGGHLSLIVARYATAYTFYATIFGEEAAIRNDYAPYFYMNDYTMAVAKKAALDAVRNPFTITPQTDSNYVGENTSVPADIQFNFTAETPARLPQWNDIGPYFEFTAGLKDVKGNDPHISIWCENDFSSASTIGATATDTPLNMPSTVSKTALYGYSEGNFYDQPQRPKNVLHFQHLNKSLVYDITCFASRCGSTDNLETLFVLDGNESLSEVLNASNNFNNTVTFRNVKPDENGTFKLTVSAGPNNNNAYKFYYINALRISVHKEEDKPEWDETDYSDFEITHEFFSTNGIMPSASGGYDMTGYIPVKEGDVIVFSGDRSPGIPFILGYSDNEGNDAAILLGDFDANNWNDLQVTEKEITIPTGINYVRCSARNTSLPGWARHNMSVIKQSTCIDIDFALEGDERPIVGNPLVITCNGDLTKYSITWTKGNALGVFDSTVLSSSKDYVITESDYEHWLRATVCDKTGNTIFTKDTWISKLPVLYIDTEGGLPITSKKDYLTANLRIQGNTEFEQQYVGMTEIRGRGNSSWVKYPQKPYKLKLEKKTKLFGFPKSKHWTLISNFNDESCLRNYIASQLAKQLGVLSMGMTWVDVVLNGEVMGCYMLSQHVRVDKNSVDIFDWEGEAEDVADALFLAVKETSALAETDKGLLEDAMVQNLSWVTDGKVTFKGKTYYLADYGLKKEYDITKGYLFEASQKTGPSHFLTPQKVNIEVSAPEYLSTNNTMMSYVENLWKDFEAEYCRVPTVENPKNFSKYADMESMVGVWLVNEIMGQSDLINSRYCYIADDGKIHFGPAWDYDHAGACISTTRKMNFFYTFADWTTPENLLEQIYYNKWFPDPFLCQMAYDAYWNIARPFIMECVSEGGEIDKKYALFAEAAQTNDMLWGNYPPPAPNAIVRTAKEDIEFFRTFLSRHTNWLGEQFQSIQSMVEVMNIECTYPCDPKVIEDGIASPHPSLERKGFNKIIKDKHLYIIHDGKTYSIDGKEIMKNEVMN